MPMPMPQQPQQSIMSNPQLFAQLLQQMGATPPNMTAGGPPQGAMPGGQTPGAAQGISPGMPPSGMPPQAGVPMQPQTGQPQGQQIPPQIQQLLQQAMQQRVGGQPSGQPQGTPQGNRFTPQELGALGRMGDSTIAHLTPGEMTVPPQVQTPKVLATLKSEYAKKGVDPAQFTVGSPQSSINPQTGVPEYNFWSSILPMAGGLAGSLLLGPEFAGLMGSSALAGGALGGGLGSMAGGLLAGQDPMQAALTSGFGALGSYGLGSMLTGGGAAAAGGAAQAANSPAVNSFAQDAFPMSGMGAQSANANAFLNPGAQPGPTIASASKAGMPMGAPPASTGGGLGGYDARVAANEAAGTPRGLGNMFGTGINAGELAGGQLGNMIGQSIYDANQPIKPFQGQGGYKTAGQLPSFQNQLGYNTYNGPKANFQGYNPATNNPAAFNFFPIPTGS